MLVDKRLGESVLHVRFDVELLRAVRILHRNEDFRVEIWDFAAAAELDALHGEYDAQLPPQDNADVAVGVVDVANNRKATVAARVHDLKEASERDEGGEGNNVATHGAADGRDVGFPCSANE